MGLIIDPAAASVSVDGVALPLAVVTSLTEALAPEIDSCQISVPWGDALVSGIVDPVTETLPACGVPVVVTSGSSTWRGILTARHRVAAGFNRSLRLTAHGPGLAMDRSYLPSFARASLSGVAQVSGGPRFAPGTRSASAGGPGSTYYLGGSDNWTLAQALDSYLAHASYAGLPAIGTDLGSASLSRVLPDTETDGGSYLAGLLAMFGHRLALGWRPLITESGWVLQVRGLSGTAVQVDLTTGDVTDYDIGEDASAALAALEVRGGRKQYVVSADCYTSGSGNIQPNWSGGSSELLYRRFRLQNFALPDGSSSVLAEPIPSLPIAASATLTRGSSPWLVFAQKADSSWISLQGKVSVSVAGTTIWVEGISAADWASWQRLRFTLCLSPRAHLSSIKTGGAGLGRGLSIVGARHVHAAGASVAISGSSLADVTGSVAGEQDPIDNQADELWSRSSGPQIVATWIRDGVWGGAPAPGTRISGFLLPVPGGTAIEVSGDCLCSSRIIAWSGGRPRTTWQVRTMPYSTGGISRGTSR